MFLRPYKITSFDQSFEEIAARFHLADARQILDANPDVFPTGAEDVHSIAPSLVGRVLQLPFPDEYGATVDWGKYQAHGGETLAVVCSKMNKDPRIDPTRRGKGVATPPWLTPEYLLDLYENADVRGAHGGDPDSVKLGAHETVWVPFPQGATRHRAIPTSHDLPTTVSLDPPWLVELIAIYEGVRAQARQLEAQINALRELQKDGLREVARVLGMERVLAILEEHPAKPRQLLVDEMAQLPRVQSALTDLRKLAMEKLYDHIVEAERSKQLKSALDLGSAILTTLRSSGFYDLAKKLRQNASRYPLRINELCAALGYAAQVIADSPLGDEVAKDVEAAVKYVASSKKFDVGSLRASDADLAEAVENIASAPEPQSVFGVMVSMVRNVGGLVTSSVGNLPGPSTLAVAFFRIQALRAASKILAAGKTVTTVEINVEVSTIVAFARISLAEDDEAGEEILLAISEIRKSATLTQRTSVATNQAEILARYDRMVAGRYMGSPAWTGGMTVAGLLVLVFSIADMTKVGANQTDVMAAIGGATTTVLGAAQLFNMVESTTLKSLGRIAAVVGVALAGYQWYTDAQAGADTTGDKAAFAGSALLAASLVPEPFSPLLAAAGGLLVVGSIVYSLVHDDVIRNFFRNDCKKWFLGQTRTFRTGAHYKAQEGALRGATQQLEDAVLAADFFYVDKSQEDLLRRLVSQEEVGMLLGQ